MDYQRIFGNLKINEDKQKAEIKIHRLINFIYNKLFCPINILRNYRSLPPSIPIIDKQHNAIIFFCREIPIVQNFLYATSSSSYASKRLKIISSQCNSTAIFNQPLE